MKKKLLTALLVGAMALNITACGGSSDAAAPADNDQQTTTTDTAADDAADTEEDAVDVEDAAEAADTTEEEGFSLLDVTADLVDAALYAVDDDNTEYVITLFRDPDGYSYVSLMIVPQDGQGDVLIAWENEAFFALQEYPGEYEIVVPSASVLCQPTVAKVDEVTQMNGTEGLADAYLSFLYTDDAQRLEAQNFYRPVNKDIQKEYKASSDSRNIKEIPSDGKWIVKDIDMADIGYFGGWEAATQKFFSDGGIFDKIYD